MATSGSAVDFLGEGSLAGPLLLRLVSRGNAIVAELLRLSENIPRSQSFSLFSFFNF